MVEVTRCLRLGLVDGRLFDFYIFRCGWLVRDNDLLFEDYGILPYVLDILSIARTEKKIPTAIVIISFRLRLKIIHRLRHINSAINLQILLNRTGRIQERATLHKIPNGLFLEFQIPRHLGVTVNHFLWSFWVIIIIISVILRWGSVGLSDITSESLFKLRIYYRKILMHTFVARHFFARNKFLIGGNWKSNNTLQQSIALINNTINGLKYDPSKVDVVIAPINLHIPAVQAALKNKDVKIAAQNASNYGFGAYTGEVSAKHLKDAGLQWVILGHSERRTIIKENDALIVSKTKHALDNGLKVIYCFGETLEQRKANKTWDVLDTQLKPLIAAFPADSKVWTESIVLAYEPVWAIGTGISSSPEQTREVFDWLRKRLAKDIPNADKIRILYGGSANGKNAKQYLGITSVDGLLVGGASLKPEFGDMINACSKV